MNIYRNNCYSLPEQVQINKDDIEVLKQMMPEHGFWKQDVTIKMPGPGLEQRWVYDESTKLYNYIVNNEYINSDTIVTITPQSESVLTDLFIESYTAIRHIKSFNGGYILAAFKKPLIDMQCTIYFTSNVTKTIE